jgi:transcriptional regulator with XRE-family HTH domain
MKFKDLLIQSMAARNTTVEAMAKTINVAPLTIVNWRNGKYKPNSAERVIDCAKYLQLSSTEKNELLIAAGFEPDVPPFIKELFLELPRHRVILLLTQADWSESPYNQMSETLLDYAKNKYGQNHILHIKPPANPEITSETYFSKLGKSCQFGEVVDADSFEYALETRLDIKTPLFLLVSRFEQGANAPSEQFARIIRSATTSAPHFHVILCGGQKLADLKYQNGDMSLLNHAEVKYYPELTIDAVYTLLHAQFNNMPLSFLNDTLAKDFLELSGGVPKLLTECLALRQQNPDLPLKHYPEKLSQSRHIHGLFMPLMQEPANKEKICQWLQKEEVGKAEAYIQDDVLRGLYWNNLLVERQINEEKRLFWRSEAMRITGNQICGATNDSSSPSTHETVLL